AGFSRLAVMYGSTTELAYRVPTWPAGLSIVVPANTSGGETTTGASAVNPFDALAACDTVPAPDGSTCPRQPLSIAPTNNAAAIPATGRPSSLSNTFTPPSTEPDGRYTHGVQVRSRSPWLLPAEACSSVSSTPSGSRIQ